jgi:hypothetical protein
MHLLTSDLFNDAVIISDSVASIDTMINEQWLWKKHVWGRPAIPPSLRGTEENVEEIQHNQTSGRALNAGPLENEALTVR